MLANASLFNTINETQPLKKANAFLEYKRKYFMTELLVPL